MDFPKKWLIVSFIAHVIILWAFGYIFIGTEQPISRSTADFHYFKITESEPPPAAPPPPTAETPPKVKEEPEKVPPSSYTAREKFKITPPPLPELPPDFMLVKKKVDSTAIKRENLKRVYRESMVVPYKVDMFALYDMPMPVPEIHLTREDTLQMINRLFSDMNIQNVGILNDIVADRYYSRYSYPTVPVDALINAGISLASDLITKIFSRKSTTGVDRFLTFDEINVMKLVWKLKNATPGQVYSQMPEYIKLSMSDISIILEQLTEKGVVKKVQAKNEEVHSPLEQLIKKGVLKKGTEKYEAVYSAAVSRLEIVIFYFNQYSNIKYIAESEGSYDDMSETLEKIEEKIMMLSTEEIKK